jgi:formylglycine-generating enzyme required for sulfatase activity
MKWALLAVLLLWLPRPSWAQPAELLKSVEAPGVRFIQDSVFMDEAEVANIHWLEYLYFLRRDSSEAGYRSQLPDSTLWQGRAVVGKDTLPVSLAYYLRSPSFRYYPVVGISWAQARRYCAWRTAVVNRQYLQSAEYQRRHRQLLRDHVVSVDYHLPSVAEWELAAAGQLNPLNFPHGLVRPPKLGSPEYRKQLLPKPKTCYGCLRSLGVAPYKGVPLLKMEFNVQEKFYLATTRQAIRCSPKQGLELTDTRAYAPNAYGLYNMIGNVAELTSMPGVAKGGSFAHSIRDFTLKTNFRYTDTDLTTATKEWLGFRCACTVKVRKK